AIVTSDEGGDIRRARRRRTLYRRRSLRHRTNANRLLRVRARCCRRVRTGENKAVVSHTVGLYKLEPAIGAPRPVVLEHSEHKLFECLRVDLNPVLNGDRHPPHGHPVVEGLSLTWHRGESTVPAVGVLGSGDTCERVLLIQVSEYWGQL